MFCSVKHYFTVYYFRWYLSTYICIESSLLLKGIVINSNYICLLHESDYINKWHNFQSFSWFQFYGYKIHMFQRLLCNKLILGHGSSCENGSYFTLKWFLLDFFRRMCFLEKASNKCKKIKGWNFWESFLWHLGVCLEPKSNTSSYIPYLAQFHWPMNAAGSCIQNQVEIYVEINLICHNIFSTSYHNCKS